jgi:hypothetical protein
MELTIIYATSTSIIALFAALIADRNMSKRVPGSTSLKEGVVDTDSNDEDTKVNKKATVPPQKKGLNLSAIFILVMMLLPAAITIGTQVWDYLYPEDALARKVRDKVRKCYEVAKPSSTPSEIDKIMLKYKGKENALLNALRNKYTKFPECH